MVDPIASWALYRFSQQSNWLHAPSWLCIASLWLSLHYGGEDGNVELWCVIKKSLDEKADSRSSLE